MRYNVECVMKFKVEATSKVDALCQMRAALMDMCFDYDVVIPERSIKINTNVNEVIKTRKPKMKK